jgi:preprotein translocase subunit SecG
METLVQIIHILDAVVLVVVVLLQQGKGAGMGLAFGGSSSSTVFGGAGAGNFLTKITTGAAIVFMVTSLSLAYMTGRTGTSLMRDVETPAATQEAAPEGAPATAPTSAGETTGAAE